MHIKALHTKNRSLSKIRSIRTLVQEHGNVQIETVRRQVLGGYAQWKRWREGASVESVFNMTRPKYPIKRYVEVLGYNSKKRFRSDYLGYGKVGYFDEAFEELSIDEICKNIGVNRRDIDEIEQMTKYKVEGAVYYLNANRRIIRVGERSRVSAFDYELKAMIKAIHSHPSGTSFSPKDVELTLGYGIKQSVAFNDVYVYSLTIDEDLHMDRRLIKNGSR